MERNLYSVNSFSLRPIRFCLKRTGPFDVHLVIMAAKMSNGLKSIIPNVAPKSPISLFMTKYILWDALNLNGFSSIG